MTSVKTGAHLAAQIRALKDEALLANMRGTAQVTAEQLEEWASAINPTGFVVTGLNAKQLVEHLSRVGELTNVLNEAASMYGFELRVDEDVATRMRAVTPDGIYFESAWTLSADGEARFERASNASAPQWVQDARAKWGLFNFRDLLVKYVNYVSDVEGTTFLYHYAGYSGDQQFTEAEWAELQRVHSEVMQPKEK